LRQAIDEPKANKTKVPKIVLAKILDAFMVFELNKCRPLWPIYPPPRAGAGL
jgi:hypothetical protein